MVKNLLKNGTSFLFKKQNEILSAAIVLMITYAASMVLGILRERILVARYYFCCKELLDVYYAAFRLPDTIFQLVVIGALSASFIPVFGEQLVKDEKLAYRISSSLINVLLVIFLVLTGILFFFARSFSALIAGGFSASQIDLMASITRALFLAQGFFLVSNFLTAIIQSHQRFIVPAIAPLFYNLGIILTTVFLAPVLGIWAPVLGVIIGAFLHLAVQVPLAVKLGFSYQFVFDFRLPQVKEIFRLMVPRTIGLAVYQIQAIMAVFLATSLPSGSLTIFHLSQKLMDLPVRLFGTSIGQAALPAISSQKARGENELFKKTSRESLSQILYLAFPAMMMILILRIPVVRIAYGSRSFPWEATLLTGKVVALMSLAIFSQSANEMLVRGFYASHNTKTPLFIGFIGVFINVCLSVLLAFNLSLGIVGLAAAITVSSFLEAVLLLFLLNREIGALIDKKTAISWMKIVLATLIAGVLSWGAMRLLDQFVLNTTRTIYLIILTLIAGLFGFTVYFFLTKIFGLEEAQKIQTVIWKFSRLSKSFIPPTEIIDSSSLSN